LFRPGKKLKKCNQIGGHMQTCLSASFKDFAALTVPSWNLIDCWLLAVWTFAVNCPAGTLWPMGARKHTLKHQWQRIKLAWAMTSLLMLQLPNH